MPVAVRNVVPCEVLAWDEFYSLKRVRFEWPNPPERVYLWIEILNPAEREVTLSVQLFRRMTLVQESGDEL